MEPEVVAQIIDLLEQAGVFPWVDGGWGVDALVGHQTRPHSDLDLAIDREDLSTARAVLEGMGLRHDPTAEPGLPARLVMADGERQVDLHPLRFDEVGDGWQQLSSSGEEWGRYPASDLSGRGTIGDRSVRCLTRNLQLRFHEGYEPTGKDEHDLTILNDRL